MNPSDLSAVDNEGRSYRILKSADELMSIRAQWDRLWAEAGADVIEVGVPFSDPVADGPVIQRASERALERGTTIKGVLDCIGTAKRRTNVPIVLFSYYNPLLQFGPGPLALAAQRAGVDGVLVTDLIPEEAGPNTNLRRRFDQLDEAIDEWLADHKLAV